MAKKTRRSRSRISRSPAGSAPAAAAPVAAVPQRREQAAAPQSPKKQVDFATEYRYVLGDLRKMGLIAVAMFAVLIALSFVVH